MLVANLWINSAVPTLLASAGILLVLPPIPYGYWLGAALLALAVLLAILLDIDPRPMSRPLAGLFVLLGSILLVSQGLDSPQAGGLVCLVGGLGLTFRSSWSRRGYVIGTVGAVNLGVTIAAQAWVLWRAKGNTFQVESLAPLLAVINQIMGGSAIADAGKIWMGVSGSNAVTLTPEALAWPFLALWLVAILGWVALANVRTSLYKLLAAFFVLGLIAVIIYLIRLESVMSGYWPVEILPLTPQHLIWLIPTGLLISRWVLSSFVVDTPFRPLTALLVVPSLLAVLLIVAGWTAPYTSPLRSLTILIDDGHGGWENTKIPFTTEKYGRLSTYNYSLLAQWLRFHHTVVTTPVDSNLPQDLGRFQVVILKTPARDYASEEIQRLASYVKDGGGLLLIGDHTNLFGHTVRLNAVAAPYGLGFRVDAAYLWQTPAIPYRHAPGPPGGSDLLLRGSPSFTILTSATIVDHTVWGLPIVLSTALASEEADYSNQNYFGPLSLSPDDTVAPLALAVATPYGRGKVVAWGDSTIWSSFSMFHPGYPELILRLVGYLGSPSYHSFGQVVVVSAMIFLLGTLWVVGRQLGPLGVVALLIMVIPTGVLSALALPWQPQWPQTKEIVPSTARTVTIDLGHSDFSLNIQPTRRDLSEHNTYTTFYAWIGRTGVFPIPADDLFNLDPIRPLIVLNPVRPFTSADLVAVANFVRTGGHVLILDDATQIGTSTAPQLLNQFGIQYRVHAEPAPIYGVAQGAEAWLQHGTTFAPLALAMGDQGHFPMDYESPSGFIVEPRLSVEGATPRAVTAKGSVIWAKKAFGAGYVTVFTGSHSFNQLSFGDIWGGTEPGQFRQRLYNLEFNLLEELWSDELP